MASTSMALQCPVSLSAVAPRLQHSVHQKALRHHHPAMQHALLDAGCTSWRVPLLRPLQNLAAGTAVKRAGAAERRARNTTARAAVTASPPATAEAGHQLPVAKEAPVTLDAGVLHLALHAALLSCLAYKTPIQVEYLRLRANKKSQEEALKIIKSQGGETPEELVPELVAKLEEENKQRGFTDILKQFDEPSQYFDGKQSLFMKATVAYIFFCPTPKGQKNIIYVVFRGTEGLEDMAADLQLAQVEIKPEPPAGTPNQIGDIPNIRIHQGFRDQFVAVSTALTRNVEAAARELLESAASVRVPKGPARLLDVFKAKVNTEAEKQKGSDNDGGFEVVVTGHSLGAALATIGSFVAALEHPDVRVSYFGFGSPRVGNASFTAAYKRVIKGHALHFANRNDIVTGIPIPPLYLHVGGGNMMDEVQKKVTVKPLEDEKNALQSTGQWFKNSMEFWGWFHSQRGTLLWSQHDMGLYVTRVRALYDEAKAKAGK